MNREFLTEGARPANYILATYCVARMFCPQPLCKVQIRPRSRGTAITNKLDEYNGACGCLQLNPISCDIRLGGIVTGWYSVTPNTFPIVDPTKWDLLLDPGVLRATHTYGTTGRAPGAYTS